MQPSCIPSDLSEHDRGKLKVKQTVVSVSDSSSNVAAGGAVIINKHHSGLGELFSEAKTEKSGV